MTLGPRHRVAKEDLYMLSSSAYISRFAYWVASLLNAIAIRDMPVPWPVKLNPNTHTQWLCCRTTRIRRYIFPWPGRPFKSTSFCLGFFGDARNALRRHGLRIEVWIPELVASFLRLQHIRRVKGNCPSDKNHSTDTYRRGLRLSQWLTGRPFYKCTKLTKEIYFNSNSLPLLFLCLLQRYPFTGPNFLRL